MFWKFQIKNFIGDVRASDENEARDKARKSYQRLLAEEEFTKIRDCATEPYTERDLRLFAAFMFPNDNTDKLSEEKLLDLLFPTMEEIKMKPPTTCTGCLYDCCGQRDHMGAGGCLEESDSDT